MTDDLLQSAIEQEHRELLRLLATPERDEAQFKDSVRNFVNKWVAKGRALNDLEQRQIIRDTCAFWNINVLDGELPASLGELPENSVEEADLKFDLKARMLQMFTEEKFEVRLEGAQTLFQIGKTQAAVPALTELRQEGPLEFDWVVVYLDPARAGSLVFVDDEHGKHVIPLRSHVVVSPRRVKRLDQEIESIFPTSDREMRDCFVGEAHYQFRFPISVTFDGGEGKLTIDNSSLSILGHGDSFEKAWEDWCGRFHTRFQRLLVKRRWELTDDEKEEWREIERMVDVEAYRQSTKRRVRQIGQVIDWQGRTCEIQWESGRKEILNLASAPPDFAQLSDDRFEAVVLRDRDTDDLLQIVDFERLGPLPSEDDARELWESNPTTAELPDEDWDKYD